MMEPGVARGVDAIPATLADSLMARLDRLSAAKEVAQRAAVLGREFAYPLLAAIGGHRRGRLRQGLARLVDAEILFARGEPPAATYTFKHALIQETAYQSLLKRTRQQLHARVAQVLRRALPRARCIRARGDRAALRAGGLVAQAIAHYQRAGERATQRSANEEAIGHLRRALDLVATLPETRERHQMELAAADGDRAPLGAARDGRIRSTSRPTRARASWRPRSASRPSCRGCSWAWRTPIWSRVTSRPRPRSRRRRWRPPGAREIRSTSSRRTYEVGIAIVPPGPLLARAASISSRPSSYTIPASMGLWRTPSESIWASTRTGIAAWCHLYPWPSRPGAGIERGGGGAGEARRTSAQPGARSLLRWSRPLRARRARPGAGTRRRGRAASPTARVSALAGIGRVLRGWARVESGEGEAGIAEMQQALVELARIGSGILGAPVALYLLAEGLRKVGRHDDALGRSASASRKPSNRDSTTTTPSSTGCGPRFSSTWTATAVEEAEALFGQSLEIARRQEAKTFELRAATSLARLWQRQGKRDAGRAICSRRSTPGSPKASTRAI